MLIKSFDFTYDANIDYVPVYTGSNAGYSANIGVSLPNGNSGGYTYVPTHLTVSIEMDTQYIPIKLRNEFNLDEFRMGKLVNKGYI